MDIIDLPLHVPTAIGVGIVFTVVWLVSLVVRRRRARKPLARADAKSKRRPKKRPDVDATVAQ